MQPWIIQPPFHVGGVVLGGVVLAVLAAAVYVRAAGTMGAGRRSALAVLRLAVIAALIVILLRPMREQTRQDPGARPIFTVLLDTSASMNTPDCDKTTRLATAVARLTGPQAAYLEELARANEVQLYEFATESRRVAPADLPQRGPADGRETDIASALYSAAYAAPERVKSGVLLLSDGRQNTGSDIMTAATLLKSRKIPLWAVPLGAASQARDLGLDVRLSHNFAFAGQPAQVRAFVSQTGYDKWYAKVMLYREGKYVETRQIMLDRGRHEVDFAIREERKGVFQYSVTVEPLPGEGDTRNNTRTVFVRVVDQKSRILVVEGKPYWDTKFMLRALRADPFVEVNTVFAVNRTKQMSIGEATSHDDLTKNTFTAGGLLPRSREDLYAYDCVILGRNVDALLSLDELKLLRDYLAQRGGSVVFSRGRALSDDSGALDDIEPIVWDYNTRGGVRFELTPEGETHPAFTFERYPSAPTVLRELPEMVSVTKVADEKSLAVILARAEDDATPRKIAVIAYQRFGKGKVMSMGSVGLWRWAFMPDRLSNYDDVYRQFWSQMVRWLVDESDFLPGQDITFRTPRYSYALRDRVALTVYTKHVELAKYQPRIVVRDPAGHESELTPAAAAGEGVLATDYTPETEGEYAARLINNIGQPKEETLRFTAYSDSVESRIVAVDRDILARAAQITGGALLSLDQLNELPAKVQRFAALSRDKLQPIDLWDRGGIFTLLVTALCLEWFARRRGGLL